MTRLSARISRIEKRISLKKDDGRFTMEDLCRAMWRRNPTRCIQISEEPGEWILRSYIPRFQAEDAEQSARVDARWGEIDP